MSIDELITAVAGTWSGFSLEKRAEWVNYGPWRVRIIPNKQERQDWRITTFGKTATEALEAAYAVVLKKREEGKVHK